VVIDGAHRGRKLGFPTANLGQVQQLIPGPGVYAVKAKISGAYHNGMTSIGHNPTFGSPFLTIETYVFDFDQSLYGQRLDLDFIDQMRGMVRFPDPESLVKQLKDDEEKARSLLAKLG
jgi:riboflavin kinase/FMN adenylyltransferase